MREIGVRTQVMSAPLPSARQQERVSRILGDDHFKRMACFTEGVERLRIVTAQYT